VKPTPFQQAVMYCDQAIQSVTNTLNWLGTAQVSAPIYSATIAAIITVVNQIQTVINVLVETIQNQEAGYVITPIATVTNVNLHILGATALYVVPAGKTLIVTGWTIRNAVQIGAGNNAVVNVQRLSDGAMLAPAGTINTFAINQAWQFMPAVGGIAYDTVAAGDTVNFVVVGKDTGTENIVTVDLLGYIM
jgi:hypothetical protein